MGESCFKNTHVPTEPRISSIYLGLDIAILFLCKWLQNIYTSQLVNFALNQLIARIKICYPIESSKYIQCEAIYVKDILVGNLIQKKLKLQGHFNIHSYLQNVYIEANPVCCCHIFALCSSKKVNSYCWLAGRSGGFQDGSAIANQDYQGDNKIS